MMFRNTKILGWLVVVLLVTNLATVATVFYHLKNEPQAEQTKTAEPVPGERRTRFFKEKLQLTEEQMGPFREANRRFNRKARSVTEEMGSLRLEMLNELFADSANRNELEQIARQIGGEHEQLKLATCEFYLELKALCNEEQKAELAAIFQSLLNSDERVKLPGHRHRNGQK